MFWICEMYYLRGLLMLLYAYIMSLRVLSMAGIRVSEFHFLKDFHHAASIVKVRLMIDARCLMYKASFIARCFR